MAAKARLGNPLKTWRVTATRTIRTESQNDPPDQQNIEPIKARSSPIVGSQHWEISKIGIVCFVKSPVDVMHIVAIV
ncbi:hypothetical protein OUZ56_000334 [Daphnia magna]|uniref:Uncharacterized protein n=1 Tax=Daphnia magna TaxID=35525 RepID=A0ABQ9ZZE0_9CRUS|nr:hypothetical protein OUZ56_000334 [Daphnia magna]